MNSPFYAVCLECFNNKLYYILLKIVSILKNIALIVYNGYYVNFDDLDIREHLEI